MGKNVDAEIKEEESKMWKEWSIVVMWGHFSKGENLEVLKREFESGKFQHFHFLLAQLLMKMITLINTNYRRPLILIMYCNCLWQAKKGQWVVISRLFQKLKLPTFGVLASQAWGIVQSPAIVISVFCMYFHISTSIVRHSERSMATLSTPPRPCIEQLLLEFQSADIHNIIPIVFRIFLPFNRACAKVTCK